MAARGVMETVLLAGLLIWLTGAILTGYVASQKGRLGGLWFLGALLLFTPLLALIALTALPVRSEEEESHLAGRQSAATPVPGGRWEE